MVLLVACVDIAGEQRETQVAYTLRELEERIEEDKTVVDALLSLSIPEDPAL
jgi:tetrahydromethanopterin S-methyltransferase subunit B